MATAAQPPKSLIERERAFFFNMAIAMALVLVAGFSFNLVVGRSSFGAPLIYHVHAFVYFGWIVLFLLQSGLVATGSVSLHRRLGWLALIWIPVMAALGVAVTLDSLRQRGGPPFFDQNEFLFGNPLGVLAFAGLALGAIAMRGSSDWHRRLMCCAMASLTGPGFGRLLPMPFLIPWAWWMAAVIAPMVFLLIGVAFDRRRRGKVHPAWFVGIAALIGSQVVADLLAYSPMGYDLTRTVLEGTPGGARDMKAFFPAAAQP